MRFGSRDGLIIHDKAVRLAKESSKITSTGGKPVAVKLNFNGITQWSTVKVTVLDEQLRELPGYTASGWTLPCVRPEDLQLYANHVTPR